MSQHNDDKKQTAAQQPQQQAPQQQAPQQQQPQQSTTDEKKEEKKDDWHPGSWRSMNIEQQPLYQQDPKVVQAILDKIGSLPPLVHPNEVETLKGYLAAAARGEMFLVQGGDCAEVFRECTAAQIEAKIKVMLQACLVLSWGAKIPTIKMGRIAGQYGKPRSSPTETINGEELPSFKGDNINSIEKTKSARQHDPRRLLQAHFHSSCTLNYIRALIKGGLADLHEVKHWNMGEFKDDQKRSRYEKMSARLLESLEFMETCGVPHQQGTHDADFFTSHEGLVLEYETAVTKRIRVEGKDSFYNLGAHFIWIGNRTRQPDCAHVEYFRGVANPIGIKIGPELKNGQLVPLVKRLNPTNEPGKITVITRFGAGKVQECLPQHIAAVREAGLNVLWVCDPMHGNTYLSESGYKTRNFDEILGELTRTFQVHEEKGSHLGGVHFELTGDNVTECVGGSTNLSSRDLHMRYTTYCDPRLNYLQTLEISFLLSDLLRQRRRTRSNLGPLTPVHRPFPYDNQGALSPLSPPRRVTSFTSLFDLWGGRPPAEQKAATSASGESQDRQQS